MRKQYNLDLDLNSSMSRVCVRPISRNVSTEHLKEIFSLYGRVIDVHIPKLIHSSGFVEFDSKDSASKSIDYMDGASL